MSCQKRSMNMDELERILCRMQRAIGVGFSGPMPELAPEARAREQIDALLIAAGWTLQDYSRFNPSAARSIALREIPVTGGRCDYLLLIDRSPIGVIEAKKSGTTLSRVAEQSAYYGKNLPEFLRPPNGVLPF